MGDYLIALANKHRRELLVTLATHEEGTEIPVPEAAALGEESYEQLQIKLAHCHLPKLGDAQLVEWDSEKGVVTHGTEFENARPLIEAVDEFEATHSNNCLPN